MEKWFYLWVHALAWMTLLFPYPKFMHELLWTCIIIFLANISMILFIYESTSLTLKCYGVIGEAIDETTSVTYFPFISPERTLLPLRSSLTISTQLAALTCNEPYFFSCTYSILLFILSSSSFSLLYFMEFG